MPSGHVSRWLGGNLVVEITPKVVKRYQTNRLNEQGGAKCINDEVMLLLRLCGDQGDLIRVKLRREKSLKLGYRRHPAAHTARTRRRECWRRRGNCAHLR